MDEYRPLEKSAQAKVATWQWHVLPCRPAPLVCLTHPFVCGAAPCRQTEASPRPAACTRPGPGPEEQREEVCWAWRKAPGGRRQQAPGACRPQRMDPNALASVFAGARLTLVGDSHLRFLYSQLSLRLGGPYSTEKFHEDKITHVSGPEVELAVYWRPTVSRNQTALLGEWAERAHQASPPPDLLVMGGGSWDIWLESKNVTLWEHSVDRLAAAVRRYLEALRERGARRPVLVWATTPMRVKGRASMPEAVPPELIPKFNAAAVSRLVQPAGPFALLDMYGLTKGGWFLGWRRTQLVGSGVAPHGTHAEPHPLLLPSPFAACWEWCVPDGTHGAMPVNDVAIQILANLFSHARHRQDALLLEERRRRQGLHGAINFLRSYLRTRLMPS